jgi:surface polysaccharide O-acyltransferase-like enzyme
MFDTVWDGYSSIPGLLMTASAFLLLYRFGNVRSAFITSVGANTLGIYFIHVPILLVLERYYVAWNKTDALGGVVAYGFAIFVLSWVAALTLKRVPVLNVLFRS